MRARTRLPFLLCTIAAAFAVFAGAALGDRETAEFSASRADKSLSGKKWEDAESLYRKALDEDDTYLPARYGLAQSLLGAGKSAAAVEELRAFVESAHALDPFPSEWKSLLGKAEKQLGDIDAAGTALQKIADEYASDLLSLAERWLTKDPVLAERALRRVLKSQPGNAKAAKLIQKLGKSATGETIELFDGKSLDGWELAHAPIFQVVDGELIATCRDSTYNIRSARMFEGDYDVRVEFRIVEEYPGPAMAMLEPAWKSTYDHYAFGLFKGRIYWWDTTSESAGDADRTIVQKAPTDFKTKLDPAAWNVFEMRMRGGEGTAFVNGEEIGKEKLPDARKSGFVGLLVQNAKVAVRKVQVDLR